MKRKTSIAPIMGSLEDMETGQILEKYHLDLNEASALRIYFKFLNLRTKHTYSVTDFLQNINIPLGWNKSTPLMIAVEEGSLKIVRTLLKIEKVDLDLKNSIGNTATMIAAEYGYLEIFNLLVESHPSSLNDCNKYQQTALMLAIERNHLTIVQRILEIDSNQLEKRNTYNKDPIIIACEFGKYEITRTILNYFKDTLLQGDEQALVSKINSIHTGRPDQQQMGNTPLLFSCRGDTLEHEEIALLLLQFEDINLNSINSYGDSALSWAALAGRENVIRAILEHKAFEKPSIEHMKKILRNLCSFDFTDLKANESTPLPDALLPLKSYNSTHKLIRHQSFTSSEQVNHEGSLSAVLTYLEEKFTPEEIFRIKYESVKEEYSPLKVGLIHANIRVMTLYFLVESPNSDLLSCKIDDILTVSEQKEMLRRLSLRKDSLQLLIRFAALYDIHFDILKLYLTYIENSIGLLDAEMPIFYQCLCCGCLDNPIDERENDGGNYSRELIEKFDLPDNFINFPKHLTHVDVVERLVDLSLLFKSEAATRPMERLDLLRHLDAVDRMLLECFKAESFASKQTMQKFLENHTLENSIVRLADAFVRGPLAKCIRHKTSIVFNSGHINSYVNELYWGFLMHNSQTHIRRLRLKNTFLQFIHRAILSFLPSKRIPKGAENLIECKSNFIFLRYNPSCMYFWEGLSKALLLILLVYKVAYYYDYKSINASIFIMVVSIALYEYGEACSNRFISLPSVRSVGNYFSSIWNVLDAICLVLVFLGIMSDRIDEFSFGRGYFSVAVIFCSLSMLNYFGAYEPIGQLLIMVFAMTFDMMKFVFIFICCIFGFCVAMYSLQSDQPSGVFATRTKTFLSLLDISFLNYESFDQVYVDHDRYYILAIVIEIVYIVFTAVVLLNLIIARMSATHDRISQKSFEEWQYTRAFTVYTFLMLNERSPFSMLPPPFNLIPTLFSFLDYLQVWWICSFRVIRESSHSPWPKLISISGTASDFFVGIVVAFISPGLELVFYLASAFYRDNRWDYLLDILFIIAIFPLLYPLYVVSLITQTVNIVTWISFHQSRRHEDSQFPLCYYESQVPITQKAENSIHSNEEEDVITIHIIRLVDMLDYLAPNHLPIVQIQLQNVVNYCENCLREGTTKNFIYTKSLIRYPLQQIDLDSESLEMTIFVLDKDLSTGRNEVIASTIVPSEQVREWLANGRHEGRIPFSHGKGMIQVVILKGVTKQSQLDEYLSLSQQQENPPFPSSISEKPSCSLPFQSTRPEDRIAHRKQKSLFDKFEILKIFSQENEEVITGNQPDRTASPTPNPSSTSQKSPPPQSHSGDEIESLEATELDLNGFHL